MLGYGKMANTVQISNKKSGSTVSLTLIFACIIWHFPRAKGKNACAGRMVQCISYCYCCG